MQVTREAAVVERPANPTIHWGAIVGGLFFILAFAWLLSLLGSALGVTVADATDGEAIGSGFGIAAMIWLSLSALIAYFLGGLVVARLSGEPNPTRGALQGLTLWSVATVLTVAFGFLGVKSVVTAGAGALGSATSIAGDAVAGGFDLAKDSATTASSMVRGSAAEEVRSVLERELEQTLARAESRAGAELTEQEVDRALEGLDSDALATTAAHLAAGDMEQARKAVRDATDLSEDEVESLIDGVAAEIEESWQTSDVAQALEANFRKGVDSIAEGLASAGGPSLSEDEVRRAFSQIDAELMGEMVGELVAGRPQAAKRVLYRETTLERQDVEALVDSAASEVDERLATLEKAVGTATEAASDYAETVLWTWWISALLALIACAGGGAVGASSVERLRALSVRETVAS